MNEIDNAWRRHERILSLKHYLQMTFLQLGEELYWLAEKKQYKTLGYDTFAAYLASPDVGIGHSQGYTIKGIYETFIHKLKSPEPGLLKATVDKLEKIRKYVNEENVQEWVNKAAGLSPSDLNEEIRRVFDPPPAAPPGAALAEAKGNTIIIRCHNTRQANAIRSALAGLVEWR